MAASDIDVCADRKRHSLLNNSDFDIRKRFLPHNNEEYLMIMCITNRLKRYGYLLVAFLLLLISTFVIVPCVSQGTLVFSAALYTASINDDAAVIIVRRLDSSVGTVTVTLTVKKEEDSEGLSRVLSFDDGETSHSYKFSIPDGWRSSGSSSSSSSSSRLVDFSLSLPTAGASMGTPQTAQLLVSQKTEDEVDKDLFKTSAFKIIFLTVVSILGVIIIAVLAFAIRGWLKRRNKNRIGVMGKEKSSSLDDSDPALRQFMRLISRKSMSKEDQKETHILLDRILRERNIAGRRGGGNRNADSEYSDGYDSADEFSRLKHSSCSSDGDSFNGAHKGKDRRNTSQRAGGDRGIKDGSLQSVKGEDDNDDEGFKSFNNERISTTKDWPAIPGLRPAPPPPPSSLPLPLRSQGKATMTSGLPPVPPGRVARQQSKDAHNGNRWGSSNMSPSLTRDREKEDHRRKSSLNSRENYSRSSSGGSIDDAASNGEKDRNVRQDAEYVSCRNESQFGRNGERRLDEIIAVDASNARRGYTHASNVPISNSSTHSTNCAGGNSGVRGHVLSSMESVAPELVLSVGHLPGLDMMHLDDREDNTNYVQYPDEIMQQSHREKRNCSPVSSSPSGDDDEGWAAGLGDDEYDISEDENIGTEQQSQRSRYRRQRHLKKNGNILSETSTRDALHGDVLLLNDNKSDNGQPSYSSSPADKPHRPKKNGRRKSHHGDSADDYLASDVLDLDITTPGDNNDDDDDGADNDSVGYVDDILHDVSSAPHSVPALLQNQHAVDGLGNDLEDPEDFLGGSEGSRRTMRRQMDEERREAREARDERERSISRGTTSVSRQPPPPPPPRLPTTSRASSGAGVDKDFEAELDRYDTSNRDWDRSPLLRSTGSSGQCEKSFAEAVVVDTPYPLSQATCSDCDIRPNVEESNSVPSAIDTGSSPIPHRSIARPFPNLPKDIASVSAGNTPQQQLVQSVAVAVPPPPPPRRLNSKGLINVDGDDNNRQSQASSSSISPSPVTSAGTTSASATPAAGIRTSGSKSAGSRSSASDDVKSKRAVSFNVDSDDGVDDDDDCDVSGKAANSKSKRTSVESSNNNVDGPMFNSCIACHTAEAECGNELVSCDLCGALSCDNCKKKIMSKKKGKWVCKQCPGGDSAGESEKGYIPRRALCQRCAIVKDAEGGGGWRKGTPRFCEECQDFYCADCVKKTMSKTKGRWLCKPCAAKR